jgi:hypothetical protein
VQKPYFAKASFGTPQRCFEKMEKNTLKLNIIGASPALRSLI